MTNTYFAFGDNINRNTLGRAEVIAQAFAAIEDGFDKLPDDGELRYLAHMILTDTSVTANQITAAFTTAPSAYADIPVLFVVAANAPTGASTIDVNAIGSVQVRRFDGTEINASDWAAGSLLILVYHGGTGRYRLVSQHGADVITTAADRVQTALDVLAAAASAAAAAQSEENAGTSETNAAATLAASALKANNLSDLASASASRTNLGLGTGDSPAFSGATFNGSVVVTGTVDGRDVATDGAKLDHLSVTQAVDLDAIETRVNELDAAVVLQGAWDASAGTFPGSGTAQAGYSYIVSVAGTVNGVMFSLNDRIVAITDNASTSIYASNWHKLGYSDLAASETAAGIGEIATQAETDAGTDDNRFITPKKLADWSGRDGVKAVTSLSGLRVKLFSGLPSGVTRVDLLINGMSTDGATDLPFVQIGAAAGLTTSGYAGWVTDYTSRTALSGGFQLIYSGAAANTWSGLCSFTLLDPATDTWLCTSDMRRTDAVATSHSCVGTVALSDELDLVYLYLPGVTDDFDAGSVNVRYS